MNLEYILENYTFEKLTDKYDLSEFDCGEKDLTNFLRNDALNQQAINLNATQLIVCDDEIIGFVTLLADKLRIKLVDDEVKQSVKEQIPNLKEVPAVKIGRFAISKKYSNHGIGMDVMRQIIGEIVKISLNIGIKFIIVEGYAKAHNFYKKTKFKHLKKDEKYIDNIENIIKKDPTRTFLLYQDITNKY
ncbi:N-acetyltransferase [Methanobrevibacter sp. DSM 116169]|uniref:N-acetyltransferase n=1 Tax=Methanobrevibacter sp. DSM 116169 TaxID=3242727 RepID=UPI0038FD2F36